MKLFIKRMKTEGCGLAVMAELDKLEIQYKSVKLGQVDLSVKLTDLQHEQLKANLLKVGFELMEDDKSLLIENIKHAIYDTVHFHDSLSEIYFSEYLVWKTDCDYSYLSNIFSKETGNSIEHFMLTCKMEFANEMLKDCSLNLSEMTKKKRYNNVSHISSQIKNNNNQNPKEIRRSNSECFSVYHM